MDDWKAVPKSTPSGRPASAEPQFRTYFTNRKRGWSTVKGQFNQAAKGLVPDRIVFLRSGQRLALRAATDDDLPYVVRRTGGSSTSATGVAEPGLLFRLVPDGSLILLEPVEEG